MENFALRIKLKHGLAFNQKQPTRLCGDSLLAGILYEETGDGPGSIASLPLDHLNGVMMASQVMLRHPFTSSIKTAIGAGALNRDASLNPNFTSQFSSKHKFNANFGKLFVDNPILTNYTVFDVAEVFYLMRGDKEKVSAILHKHVRGTGSGRIGSKRNTGSYGIVSDFGFEEASQEQKLFGILSHSGRLMRPVPLSERSSLPNDISFVLTGAFETWRCPYHLASQKETCIVPITERLGFDISEIEDFIGEV